MVRSIDDELPMLVTIFDPTIAAQVKDAIEHCEVTSMADIVAPSLAGPCLGDDLEEVHEGDPVAACRSGGGCGALRGRILTPYDKSAALLLWGALGLADHPADRDRRVDGRARPGRDRRGLRLREDARHRRPERRGGGRAEGLKAFLTVSMLTALVFEASFTAGLVNRLIDRRLTGLCGRRAVPRRDHVVVVGLGQVGLRLCLLLRDLGVGVVAVDDREEGENVGLARELGLPVVIGRGADPSLLRRLSLQRAVALAAVTDDDLQNLSIAHGRQVGRRGHADRAARRRRPDRERDPVAVPDRRRSRRPPDRRA